METQTKRGRGRPKGSHSFQLVTLSELMAKCGPDTQIPVGRLWLNGREKRQEISVTIPVVPSVEAPAPEDTVEMTLIID